MGKIILEMKENCELNNVRLEDLICQKFNAKSVRIDDVGDICINDNSWLTHQEKLNLVSWIEDLYK